MPWDDEHAREQVTRVEALLTTLDALPDEAARTRATETAAALVDLYGEALARIMDRLTGTPAAAALADDELVGQLLLVHDLHPLPAEERIRRALDGTGAELLAVAEGEARVRLPAGGGCRSSAAALASAVREAVAAAAPEVRVETVTDTPAAPQTLIPAEALLAGLRDPVRATP